MSTYREEPSLTPFTSSPSPVDSQSPSSTSPFNPARDQPAGWRRLPLRLREACVYCVTLPEGGITYWHAEMTLNGQKHSRRCASELYALWWIAALNETPAAAETFVMSELAEPLHCGHDRRE